MTTQEVRDYLDRAIGSFLGDPADSDFQRGYLAALETVRDDLFRTQAERAAIARRRA